jgi:excisionase family DNA binding protein
MSSHRQRDSAGSRELAEGGREWLTLGQAAAFLGAAQSTVRKWADSGRLPAFYTPGGHRRFLREDLEAFLAGPRGGGNRQGSGAGSVLVVDDDTRLRRYLRTHLETEGFEVREARSAEEGLSALEEEPPDLILLDVRMPRMDGWEMLRRMQEEHGIEAVPVIMYSGDLEEPAEAEERGARAFVGKPLEPRRLLDAVRQLLRS